MPTISATDKQNKYIQEDLTKMSNIHKEVWQAANRKRQGDAAERIIEAIKILIEELGRFPFKGEIARKAKADQKTVNKVLNTLGGDLVLSTNTLLLIKESTSTRTPPTPVKRKIERYLSSYDISLDDKINLAAYAQDYEALKALYKKKFKTISNNTLFKGNKTNVA